VPHAAHVLERLHYSALLFYVSYKVASLFSQCYVQTIFGDYRQVQLMSSWVEARYRYRYMGRR
jgi:hypothetical protein